MDPDMNKYDLEHVTTAHPIMSKDEWQGVYWSAWSRYYTDQHVETVLHRAVKDGLNPKKICDAMTIFSGAARIEGVHPAPVRLGAAQGAHAAPLRHEAREPAGVLRQAHGRDRPHGGAVARTRRRYRGILKRVVADPNRMATPTRRCRKADAEHMLPDFIDTFAAQIPNTHGAPQRQAAAA
jgi:hypothetical protein